MIKFSEMYFKRQEELVPHCQFGKDISDEDSAYPAIEKLLKLWDDYKLYKKNDVHLFSKYYVVNKKKKDNSNIQENIRQKVRDLNRIHKDNRYFFNLSQNLISNNENKHKYNNFDVSVVEFESVSVATFFKTNELLFHINLPKCKELSILKNTFRFLKESKEKLSETDKKNKSFEHHSELINQSNDFLNCAIFKVYDNPFGMRVDQIVDMTSQRCCKTADPEKIAVELNDEELIKELADLYIMLGLNYNTKWVNIKKNQE